VARSVAAGFPALPQPIIREPCQREGVLARAAFPLALVQLHQQEGKSFGQRLFEHIVEGSPELPPDPFQVFRLGSGLEFPPAGAPASLARQVTRPVRTMIFEISHTNSTVVHSSIVPVPPCLPTRLLSLSAFARSI